MSTPADLKKMLSLLDSRAELLEKTLNKLNVQIWKTMKELKNHPDNVCHQCDDAGYDDCICGFTKGV